MYPLTLTHDERKAIDWIGYRYSHGDELFDVLCDCDWYCNGTKTSPDNDVYWTSYTNPVDITFDFPNEALAWKAKELIEADSLACFASSLVEKLTKWTEQII